jgi:hypothetical protein
MESQRYKFNLAAQSIPKESVARVRSQGKNVLKVLCHEMNIFLKAYDNKQVLSVRALVPVVIFTIFCF